MSGQVARTNGTSRPSRACHDRTTVDPHSRQGRTARRPGDSAVRAARLTNRARSSFRRCQNARSFAMIPAYQEGPRIAAVVEAAGRYLPVIVVDDGSTDDTAAAAEAAGATVIRQVPNAGKGAALRAGFAHAREAGADAVVTLDADGQHDPAEIPAFLDAYRRSGAQLVVGRRDFGAMPVVRRASNTLGSDAALRGGRPGHSRQPVRLPIDRVAAPAGAAHQPGGRLRIRGRDDRALDRARSADRLGAGPDDLCRRAQPHPAVGPFHGASCASFATLAGSCAPLPSVPATTERADRRKQGSRAVRFGSPGCPVAGRHRLCRRPGQPPS